MIKRLLVANRGEIACRIIRTARARQILCVGIYSHCDQNSQHVQQADEAWCVGDNAAEQSYLNQEKILRIAKQSRCDAIHPGYGFLSENADFAEACHNNNIIFIGPPADAIRQMGSKIASKEIMEEAGIPLVSGADLSQLNKEELNKAILTFDYPVLLKASTGGGGKGMRVVASADEFMSAYHRAQSEAEKSFGDNSILLEKYLSNPRHVEVQIFTDQHGNGVYLFDRDCSVQRRHQKIVEEAPAPFIDTATQKKMGECALKSAQRIHYHGAGTVEFLLDTDQNFYFMEMNTRLQVEHPVSEFITGLDFVAMQIDIAEGKPLTFSQKELSITGHSVEARLYAEDPEKDFLPVTGKLDQLQFPETGKNLRIDSGVVEGDNVSPFYDPMLAKIISHGSTREEAILTLLRALNATRISGIKTNLDYLKAILGSNAFVEGRLSTSLIQESQITHSPTNDEINEAFHIAALALFLSMQGHNNNPWKKNIAWRLNQAPEFTVKLQLLNGEYCEKRIILFAKQDNHFSLKCDSFSSQVQLSPSNKQDVLSFIINQRHMQVAYFIQNNHITLHLENYSIPFMLQQVDSNNFQSHQSQGRTFNSAPMSGRIVQIFQAPNEKLQSATPILVIEAMKMEYIIKAPAAGYVTTYHVHAGSFVDEGALLFDFKPEQ